MKIQNPDRYKWIFKDLPNSDFEELIKYVEDLKKRKVLESDIQSGSGHVLLSNDKWQINFSSLEQIKEFYMVMGKYSEIRKKIKNFEEMIGVKLN